MSSYSSKHKEGDTHQYHPQTQSLALQMLLLEKKTSYHESYHYRAAANHRDNCEKGILVLKGKEVAGICSGDKYCDEQNPPVWPETDMLGRGLASSTLSYAIKLP